MSDDIYTDLDQAVGELKKRQQNPSLIKKVLEYVNNDIPEPLINPKVVRGVLARHLFTPDYELDAFLQHIKQIGAEPVLLEYLSDKFLAENDDKKAFGKLLFYLNTDKSGKVNMFGLRIIDFNKFEGFPINEVYTLWGEKMVDFHHRILNFFFPSISNSISDQSEWIHRGGKNAFEYYERFLSLFVCHAILFDNFRTSGVEADLFHRVFLPSFKKVTERFGVKPIICPIQSIQDEDNEKWWGYPKDRMNKIMELSSNVHK